MQPTCGVKRVFGSTWTRLFIAAALAFATCSRLQAESNAPERESGTVIGHRVPNFVLNDAAGNPHALADYADKRAVVLVFLSSECPVNNRYAPVLEEMSKQNAEQSVQWLAIYASPSDNAEKIAAHVKQYEITLPALHDDRQEVMQAVGARRTAEVFLLDGRRAIRYHGRIDDRIGYEHDRDEPSRDDLQLAIGELLERKEISVPETTVQGCLISHHKSEQAAADVTYSNQVVRILQEKCQTCHRPGTVAPFSLLEPDDAVHWSDMIKQVVLERRMPPWHADARYGKFSNDRRLSQEQIDTLVSWVDGGAPVGDKSQLPSPREFSEGWTIGEPDMVFELPQEINVPAKGTVPYLYFETPTNFKEDMWIQAAEARPGNRAVVHHIIAFYREPKGDRQKIQDQWIAGTAPGDMALILPPGVGRKIPAGATLVWQMHYTPTGKEEKDRSQLGLIFYKGKEPPRQNALTHGVGNHRFLIPPGNSYFQVESEWTVPRDLSVLSFMPHMHLRGKDFIYRAVYPDGRNETLLSVPRFDFSWQSTYRCPEPLRLPKGTKVQCTAHFDNSTENPANPDPTKMIHWGDQTWDEMMIGYMDYVWDE